ncbi:acetyltransferase, partial [Acrasis kona]
MLITATTTCIIIFVSIAFWVWRRKVRKDNKNDDQYAWKLRLSPSERYYLKNWGSSKHEGTHNITATMQIDFKDSDQINYESFRTNVEYVLRALQLKHPLLQVGLLYDCASTSFSCYRDCWYFARKKVVPKIQLEDTNDSWEDAHKHAMNRSWELDGPFMGVTIAKGEFTKGKLYIVFRFHHVICDASCCSNLVSEFALILNDLKHGSGPESELPCTF